MEGGYVMKKTYCVANYNGNLAGHDLDLYVVTSQFLAAIVPGWKTAHQKSDKIHMLFVFFIGKIGIKKEMPKNGK